MAILRNHSHGLSIALAITSSFVLTSASARAATIAYWQFTEGSGQTATNSEGSSTLNLQLGSTNGTDANDPAWVADGVNGAVDDTYLTNTGWTAGDVTAMGLYDTSYTIETIIKPDSLPVSSSFGDRAMGLITYNDGANSNHYILRIYNDQFGTSSDVAFYNSDNTTLYYNTNAANDTAFTNTGDTFLITPGNSYYVAMIFDSTTGQAQLLVRDLASGQEASATTSWAATPSGANPANLSFYAGAESSARSFDGTIYGLRISNDVVPEQSRLHNVTPEPMALALFAPGLAWLVFARRRDQRI